MKIASVILAGGAGTRLWPLSREDKPKQFHDLTGEGTLLEATIKRLLPLKPDICIIATSGAYEQMSKSEIKKTGIKGRVLIEPSPRNTAPAILYSALYLSKMFDESIMIVLPADHYIKRNDIFIETIKTAIKEAEKDSLVTLGIKPVFPETGYGYIKAGKSSGNVLKVESFVEKPDRNTAEKYLLEGNYFWNAGMFIWKTSVILNCFKELMPDLYNAFLPLMEFDAEKIASDKEKKSRILKEKIFSSIKPISIDYGVMEKAMNKVVIPADFGWTDLGSWISIDEILMPDECSNRCPGKTKPVFVSSNNCSVFSEGKTIALVGVDNIVVVESGNNILVINKNNNQEVRKVVDILKSRNK
jgi:mannose-1-phosphate guanylyltransferase